MVRKYMLATEFFKALEAAGVVTDLDTVTRVVIDVQPGELVQVYVQRIAGSRLPEIAGMLGEMMRDGTAAASGGKRGVRYWVLFDVSLLDDKEIRQGFAEAGARWVGLGAWQGTSSRWVLIEDDGAPPELEGREVELSMTRGRRRDSDLDDSTWISERRVTGPGPPPEHAPGDRQPPAKGATSLWPGAS